MGGMPVSVVRKGVLIVREMKPEAWAKIEDVNAFLADHDGPKLFGEYWHKPPGALRKITSDDVVKYKFARHRAADDKGKPVSLGADGNVSAVLVEIDESDRIVGKPELIDLVKLGLVKAPEVKEPEVKPVEPTPAA